MHIRKASKFEFILSNIYISYLYTNRKKLKYLIEKLDVVIEIYSFRKISVKLNPKCKIVITYKPFWFFLSQSRLASI
jgi:hypothetical protein